MHIANDDLYAQSWNTNFGSNPFDDGLSEYSQNTEDTEYFPIQIPEENRPPSPGSSPRVGGAQCNRPLDRMIIMKMKFHSKSVKAIKVPEKLKDKINPSEDDIQKPQKIPEIRHCKKYPKRPAVKNTTYDLIPTQITQTHTDTNKRIVEETFIFQILSPIRYSAY